MDLVLFGNRVREAREKAGLTQEELAERIDISPSHISVIERGIKAPRLDTFVRISNTLRVSADFLLQDLVEQAHAGVLSEHMQKLEALPPEQRTRALAVLRALTE